MAEDTLYEYRGWCELGGTLERLNRHLGRLDGALPLLHRSLEATTSDLFLSLRSSLTSRC